MWQSIKKTIKSLTVCFVILALFLAGFPSKDFFSFARDAITDRNVIDSLYHAMRDKNVIDKQARFLLDSPVSKASAATFQMETGYYVGNGGALSITGLGFRPEMIILKSNTNTIATVFHTNIMPDATTAYMGTATADSTAGFVQLDADGFTVYSTANTANIRYTYIAFTGSDCSASGTMCIGSYVGNGAANQAITSVGFQPDLVWAKRTSNERAATWRSSSMPTNYGQYFSATTEDTTGVLFQTLDSTGFTVGLSNNTSTGVYYYVAFKEVSGFMDVGTYTGNAANDRSITGVGFKPDWVFLKNSATTTSAVHSQRESYGDSSGYFTKTANVVDSIQLLETDGFQVGTHSTANGTGNTIYYSAFKGATTPSASGSFQSASGSYTGDNTIKIIEGLDFKPDLVIIKGETTQQGVFRTSLMPGNSTAYLGAATANFSGGVTAINHDGFTIGDNATVNSNGVVYHWQAFGNAWNPHERSGAADFAIGAYYGNTIDNRDITGVPFQPDMVVVKRNGASAGLFRTSAHTGDLTSAFAATADAANHIQAFNTDGFEVGNVTTVINTDGTLYWWFAFKEGTDFDVGTYTGDAADNRDITAPGFDPDLVWIKRSTAIAGVTRPSTLAGDLTQYFITTAQAAGRIKSFVTGGFRLGTQTEVNASGGTYYFVAWDNNSTQDSVTPADYAMKTGYFMGNGYHQEITGLGFRPELVILKSDTTAGHSAVYKTRHMPESGINAFSGNSSTATLTETSGYDIVLLENGFRIAGANTNTSNIGHTWIAFAGSDCSASGTMCIGSYIGDASGSKVIPIGFQTEYIAVGIKSSIVEFNTIDALTALDSGAFLYDGFSRTYLSNANRFNTIGSSTVITGSGYNLSGIYYTFAFNNGSFISTGTYTGDGTDNRNITGVGFTPDAIFNKGNDNGYPTISSKISFGDNSSFFFDQANATNYVQLLLSDGFEIGTASNVNASPYYYTAFKETASSTTSGSFTMETGTYVGNGAYKRIGGLSGKPDLVIIKGETTQQGVFRTKIMGANTTAYLGSATADLALAISSLNHDGFNVGDSATVNSSGVTYHYQAFYNAYDGLDHTGAADFAIGRYYGNGIDSRDITEIPFQPDMVTVKRSAGTAGGFRTSAHTGDLTSLFAATADTADMIQAFNTDGFEIGTNAVVNTAANNYWWFAFKEGSKFDVGTYSGNSTDNRDITDPAHTPDLVWIKRSTAVAGVMRPGTLAGDLTQWFINTAQAAGRIKALISSGFTLGTQTEVNATGGTYYFSSWSIAGVPQPTLTQSAYRFFENTDTTDVGTALEVQNTAAQLANAGDAFRLRLLMAVDDANLAINGEDFKLQFADKGTGTCASPSGGTPASYTDVTGATVIAYNDNATPTDGTALTANANDPTDGGRTIVNQSYQELNDFTNDEAAINNGQTGKWDFSLIDNGADPDTTFCFRIVTSTGTVLDTYTVYPEITTAAATQSLTFSISDNSVGFGNLSASAARYATGDTSGSGTDSADAHTISVAATATDGYSLTVNGSTLTCSSCSGATIDAIGGVAEASSVGTEQFGLRLIVNSGTGLSTAPYASADWAFDTANLPDQVASGAGDGSTTIFGVRYLANTESISEAGEYSATLTYTATATY